MSKEEIIAAIRECAEKLGHTPSFPELANWVNGSTRGSSGKQSSDGKRDGSKGDTNKRESNKRDGARQKISKQGDNDKRDATSEEIRKQGISKRMIRKHFGSYTNALRESGLERRGGGPPVALELLFKDWAVLARRVGRVPSMTEYETQGKYSLRPLLTRFGTWTQVPYGLLQYAKRAGLESEWGDVLGLIGAPRPDPWVAARTYRLPTSPPTRPKVLKDRPMYGPPLMPTYLAHGPINEAGVVYLFGMLAGQLGFVVTRVQTEFPDCEAMRQVEQDRWQRVRIEFEYESRNFLRHLHDVRDCDVIVCWLHNWPECPLDVVELSAVVREGREKDRLS